MTRSETATLVAAGRYAAFARGTECGEERWRIDRGPEGYVIAGTQEMLAPHPFPNRQDYRVALDPRWRIHGLEIRWRVGDRELLAVHRSAAGMWRVRIEYAGQVKEQEGDFPEACEVDYGTPLFSTILFARRDFSVGGEHEFPVLRVGPPFMAVQPERLLYRCVESQTRATPWGPRPARRYVVSVPGRAAEAYSLWSDERGVVLESFEGAEPGEPWMRLVEYEWE